MSGSSNDHERRRDRTIDTLVEFGPLTSRSTDSSLGVVPSVVFDPNRFRLERMMQREHLVYGVPTPFVGRSESLNKVHDAAKEALDTTTLRTVIIEGDNGTGKTRLTAELLRRLEKTFPDIKILGACCSEADDVDDISVLGQLLRRRFGIIPNEPIHTALGRIEDGLAGDVGHHLGPSAIRDLAFTMGLPRTGQTTTTPQDSVVIDTMATLLKADAGQHPQVLIFHRAQHLTERTKLILEELAGQLLNTRTVIVFLRLQNSPELPEAFSPLSLKVRLAPLQRQDMVTLVTAVLSKLDTIPDVLINALVTRAAGNPRLAEDNIRLLVQRGLIETKKDGWTLREDDVEGHFELGEEPEALSRARIAVIPVDIRHVLSLASVFGESFWFGAVLSALRVLQGGAPATREPWFVDPTADWLGQVLESAVTSDLIFVNGDSVIPGHQEFTFSSDSDRVALYESLPMTDRNTLHRVAAQWLTSRAHTQPGPWHERAAEHYLHAGDTLRGAQCLLKAGLCARALHDLGRTKALLHRAMTLCDVDASDVLIPALEGFAEACFTAAEFELAERSCRAMLEASLIPQDVAAGARAWLMLGRVFRSLGNYAQSDSAIEHARALFHQIGDEAGTADCLEQVAIMLRLGGARGACEDALVASRHALEIRKRVGSPAQVARSLEHIASTQLQLGRLEEAQQGLAEVLDLRDDLGDQAGLATAWGNMGTVHAAKAEFDSAIAAWRTALEYAERTGQKPYIPAFLNNIGEAYVEMGSFALAQTALKDARTITEESGDLGCLADILRNQGALMFAKGDAEGALTLVDEAIALCKQVGSRHAMAQALRTRGEVLGAALFESDHTPNGEFGSSDMCFRRAASIFEEIGDIIALERTLRAHAKVMDRRGNLEASDTLLDKADAIRTQRG